MLKSIYRIGYLLEVKKRISRVQVEKIFIEQLKKEQLERVDELEEMENEMEKIKNIKNKTDKLKNDQIKLFREIEETKKAKQDMEIAMRKLAELKILYKTILKNIWT